LHLANNVSTDIKAAGSIAFTTEVNGNEKNIILNDVLHVPNLRDNLLSVSKITDKDYRVLFDRNRAIVSDRKGNIKLQANRMGNLYFVSVQDRVNCNRASEDASDSMENLKKWHRRLGHLNTTDMFEGARNRAMQGFDVEKPSEKFECEICIQGKMTRTPFPLASERHTEDLLEIVHTDICGPMRTESKSGARYFITFIDDRSKWCEVRFIRNKSDALNAFKQVKSLFETLIGKKIKFLQSDNGQEYLSKEFEQFLKENGIQRRLSVPYNPEQNGTAERKNRTLLDVARCLLI